MLNILSRAHTLVPGISKVISVSYNTHTENYEILFLNNSSHNKLSIEEITPDDNSIRSLKKLSQEKISFSWYSPDDIPFGLEKTTIKQMDVFKELEKNILMLSIPQEHSKTNDLLFFYFNNNVSNFIITQSKKVLSQEHKQIIGAMLFNSIITILSIVRNDRKSMESFNGHVNKLIDSIKTTQATVEIFREKQKLVILNYAYELIQELSLPYTGIIFDLSKNAVKKIQNFDGDMNFLKESIKNAMFFASGLSFGDENKTIVLDDFHINFSDNNTPESKQLISQPSSRQTKTLFLLDKLEEAALIVLKEKKALTGSNVGKSYYKPISAPGISDALKNHKKTIRTLIKENPDKWSLIRNEFKPLINILSAREDLDARFDKQA